MPLNLIKKMNDSRVERGRVFVRPSIFIFCNYYLLYFNFIHFIDFIYMIHDFNFIYIIVL